MVKHGDLITHGVRSERRHAAFTLVSYAIHFIPNDRRGSASFAALMAMMDGSGGSVPADARSLARFHLRDIAKRVDTALAGDPINVMVVLFNGTSFGPKLDATDYLEKTYSQEDLVRVYYYLLAHYKTLKSEDPNFDVILDQLDYVWYSFTEETIQKVDPK